MDTGLAQTVETENVGVETDYATGCPSVESKVGKHDGGTRLSAVGVKESGGVIRPYTGPIHPAIERQDLLLRRYSSFHLYHGVSLFDQGRRGRLHK